MNPMTRTRIATFIVAVLLFIGGQPVQAPAAERATLEFELSKLAPDLRHVISALVMRMRGFKPELTKPVAFAPGVGQVLRETEFDYQGFDLVQVVVSDFRRHPKNKGLARVEGALRFADKMRRRVLTAFFVQYRLKKKAIVIEHARLGTITTGPLSALMFFVPAERMTALRSAFANHGNLLAKVAGAAVPMAEPAKVPRTVGDYYAFAFIFDRLPPGARITARLSGSQKKTKSVALAPMTVNYEGWQVILLRARFAFGSGPPIFFKLAMQPPGKGAATSARVFSTALREAPGVPPATGDFSTAAKLVPLEIDPALRNGFIEAVDGTMQKIIRARLSRRPTTNKTR